MRKIMAALLVALALIATACTGSKQQHLPAQTGAEITEAQAPQALKDWVASQANNLEPAYHTVTEGDATYIAVTGGMHKGGNYQLVILTIETNPERLYYGLAVQPTTTGGAVVPVKYFKVEPKFTGEIKVEVALDAVTTQPEPGTAPLFMTIVRTDGQPMLYVKGMTPIMTPTMRVQVRSGEQMISEQAPSIEHSWYEAKLPVPDATRYQNLDIVLVKGTEVLIKTTYRPEAAAVAGSLWSENFEQVTARQTDDRTVVLEGKARAFEAVFKVEIRAGGKVVAAQSVKADAGAPAYGKFQATIKLPADLPLGAEAWFLIPQMKDGTDKVDLVTTITRAK